MLDHISFPCSNLDRTIGFYDAVLGALGYRRLWTTQRAAGWGTTGVDERFAVKLQVEAVPPGSGFHLAFTAPAREAVRVFHQRALAQGGRDNGAPGLRPAYGPDYFAAFVYDPDGHAVEAVCHSPS